MAIAYHRQLDEKTAFAVWKIEESAEELVSRLQLKSGELAYIESLNNGKRNLHWLSTRVLLREMLNTNKYINCEVDEHGKPYLVNFPHQISLSHSFDYAAVMISEDKPVGIDIELVKEKIVRIEDKFLCREELLFIDPAHTIEHLYICWCAKEAIYKLQGKRNVSFKDHIRLHAFPYAPQGRFEASLETDQEFKSFDVNYESFHDYMIGYVAGERGYSSNK
ncbi:4'-phosphopantetheinyl transferase family protein [Arcticibacter tournemirensis]